MNPENKSKKRVIKALAGKVKIFLLQFVLLDKPGCFAVGFIFEVFCSASALCRLSTCGCSVLLYS